MANFVTGLDIGSSQMKCVVAEEGRDAIEIVAALRHPSAGLRKGIIVDVEDATNMLRELVLDLQKISKRAVHDVYVNVSGEHIKSRVSRGTTVVSRPDQEIQQDDVERVLHSAKAVKLTQNHTVLHNIPREFFIDDVGDIENPLGMTGNRLEVSTVIVEVFAPQLNLLIKTLERVGLRIGGLIFNPLASGKAVLTQKQKELGVVLIDLGFGTTSLAVFEENKLVHAKTIPLGVGHVTNDIAIGFKMSVEGAEKMKLTYGFASAREVSRKDVINLSDFDPSLQGEGSKRFLAEVIEVRLAEILDLVNNELKSLGPTLQLPSGAVVTGGGVKMKGLTELVRKELRLPVHIGYPSLAGFEILNPTHQELLDDPEFATAVGLMLWAKSESRGAGLRLSPKIVKEFLKRLMP
ncbi:MAG TPA: cell division protein FtsA [Candidatus Paceibacterota bacterium]|nr:cell division protein FtsA [Candidatus Paceibacterota bacterium]